MNSISIMVKGHPIAQPRPRAMIRGGKVHVYNKDTSKAWKESIMIGFRKYSNLEIDSPVRVVIGYYFKRPKSLLRKKDLFDPFPHTKKPDLDNLDKAVLDALTELGVWKDDSLVYSLHSAKYYTSKDNTNIGALITIST